MPHFPSVQVLGPMLYPPGKRNNIECHQIIVSSSQRALRDQAFASITNRLKQTLPPRIKIKCQVDSHLSAI